MANQSGRKFYFVGNNKGLDFINTLMANDLLESFDDLVAWLTQADILNSKEANEIQAKWQDSPEAAQTLDLARELRTVLKEGTHRITGGKPLSLKTIEAINRTLARQTGHSEVARLKNGGYEKRLRAEMTAPNQLLVPIAESFVDLLCYGDLSLVKKCENSMCVLYFHDTTKNHARRWCCMTMCGNRAKAAAHYLRKCQARS